VAVGKHLCNEILVQGATQQSSDRAQSNTAGRLRRRVVPPVSLFAFLRRFALACIAVTLVTATGVLAGNRFAHRAFEGSKKIEIPNLVRARPGKPANYVLIGSDTRQLGDDSFGSPNDAPGQRSDVIMVLHVDPANRTGRLVSFPRDLLVNIPGHGQQLLNAAYGLGGANGPALVIQTLEANFPPLKINHYIEVNFKGFEAIVDVIGKVPLYFPTPVHDPYSGLNVDAAGCVKVDGAMALAYARSRHYYVPRDVGSPAPWQWDYPNESGGQGWTATGSDLERIPRQQYFLRTISQAALDKTAANPTKLFALLNAVKNNFTRDSKLKFGELQDLIRTFKGLDPRRVRMETLPVVTAPGSDAHLVATDDADDLIGSLMQFGDPSPPVPELVPADRVRVRVVDGSGIPGAGQSVYDRALAAGFRLTGPVEQADRTNYRTTQIRYAPGKYQHAYTAVVGLGTLNIVEANSRKNTLGADVLVIVGRDYNKLNADFSPLATTTTTPPTEASTTTRPSTTTSTTVPTTVDTRFIPRDPRTGSEIVGCPNS
jgi:LCP family protein required for cell wall assembly